jgi:hypothetical protein
MFALISSLSDNPKLWWPPQAAQKQLEILTERLAEWALVPDQLLRMKVGLVPVQGRLLLTKVELARERGQLLLTKEE